jgi:hypothetical protein
MKQDAWQAPFYALYTGLKDKIADIKTKQVDTFSAYHTMNKALKDPTLTKEQKAFAKESVAELKKDYDKQNDMIIKIHEILPVLEDRLSTPIGVTVREERMKQFETLEADAKALIDEAVPSGMHGETLRQIQTL